MAKVATFQFFKAKLGVGSVRLIFSENFKAKLSASFVGLCFDVTNPTFYMFSLKYIDLSCKYQ